MLWGNLERTSATARSLDLSSVALFSSWISGILGMSLNLSLPRLLLRKRRAICVTSSVRLQVAWSVSRNQCSPRSINSCPASRTRASRRAW